MKNYSKSKFNEEARRILLEGAREVYKAVGTTLGARGRNVVLWKFHQTKSLHDGVKVAQEVNPKNPFKNAGAEIIKQAAQRQVDVVGDGTTVAVVLAYAIASEAEKIVESGVNPMALRSGLEKGRNILVEEIKKLSKPITTKQRKIEVATISSEDEELGRLIGETYHRAGVDGVVMSEQITGPNTYVDHQEGVQIDAGYRTEWFITNPNARTASVSDPKVLVTDYKLDDIYKLVPLLKNVVKTNKERNIVVIAGEIEGSVLATLVQNKMKGQWNALAVKAPSFQQKEILQDIAIVTGAKFVSKDTGMTLEKLTIDDLGSAERITSTKDVTIIMGGGGKKKAIKDRVASIRKLIKEEEKEFDVEKLRERLAKLTGGVHVVKVGGQTEIEAEERNERADDSIKATKAAIEEGIVPGGEIVFLEVIDKLKPENEDEEYAFRILKKALTKPFEILVENAGLDAGEMRANLKFRESFGFGVDVKDGKIKNMMAEGIVDPTLVATEAIRNGVSVASAIIMSDGIVVEIQAEKK